jgi:hypothetical protein
MAPSGRCSSVAPVTPDGKNATAGSGSSIRVYGLTHGGRSTASRSGSSIAVSGRCVAEQPAARRSERRHRCRHISPPLTVIPVGLRRPRVGDQALTVRRRRLVQPHRPPNPAPQPQPSELMCQVHVAATHVFVRDHGPNRSQRKSFDPPDIRSAHVYLPPGDRSCDRLVRLSCLHRP